MSEVYILTSGGGAGHLEVMKDSKERCEKAGLDVYIDYIIPAKAGSSEKSWMNFMGFDIGKYGVAAWNLAQKRGHTTILKKLASRQWMVEWLFDNTFKKKVFNHLASHPNTTQVIDTQPQNTHKILQAVYEFNHIRSHRALNQQYHHLSILGRFLVWIGLTQKPFPLKLESSVAPIRVLKRMTDCPNLAYHFFLSLKKVKEEHLAYFDLEVPHAPGLTSEESDKEDNLAYYRKKCPNLFDNKGKPKCHFIFTDGPIKKPFIEILEKKRQVLKQVPTVLHIQQDKENHIFEIPANALVKSIMLGSQADKQATLKYVQVEIEDYNNKASNEIQYLFVFCGMDKGPGSLLVQLNRDLEEAQLKKILPKNLKIMSLGFQKGEAIAKIYARSDSVILRAGGLSCLEIDATASPATQIYFHSQGKGNEKKLKESLVIWEKGNVEYIQAKRGKSVHVVTPETYKEELRVQKRLKK